MSVRLLCYEAAYCLIAVLSGGLLSGCLLSGRLLSNFLLSGRLLSNCLLSGYQIVVVQKFHDMVMPEKIYACRGVKLITDIDLFP